MASCEVVRSEPTYVLTLTQAEAQFIRDVVGHCSAAHTPSTGIFRALHGAGLRMSAGLPDLLKESGLYGEP